MNNIQADFLGLERVETYDYPEYALREALLNTIIHRDYNYSGSTIINVFSDGMEFVSIGGLVKGITLEDILHGISQSRNMVLANIFYRLKLIESYGTGIQRILESYDGKIQPQFIPAPSSFVTILPNLQMNTPASEANSLPENRVLALFKNQPFITRRDVEKLLQCSSFPARKILNSLLAQEKITVVGNAKNTRYLLNK